MLLFSRFRHLTIVTIKNNLCWNGVRNGIFICFNIFYCACRGIVYLYYMKTKKRHIERLDKAEEPIKHYKNIPYCIKDVYSIICQRRYEHIMTFFNFQLINKVFGFLSVVFSLISFASSILKFCGDNKLSTPYDDIAIIAISFLSILCVIIALYASPNRRVLDYINAWRIDERTINEMIAEMDQYSSLPLDICQMKALEYINRISTAEENIHSDED